MTIPQPQLLPDVLSESHISNIHGLGQLPFPTGRIAAVFEEVREVLEREGMIAPLSKSAD